MHDLLNFDVICFLKVCNVDKFLSHLQRKMEYMIFVGYKLYLRALGYFCYFSGGNLKIH